MKTFISVICYAVLIAAIVGIIALVYRYTNGFNEDFKTFYAEYNGEQILTENKEIELDPKEIHKFTVKYTFDKEQAERGYTVKVVPNGPDFEFAVDGKTYVYSKAKELTDAFKIIKDKSSFEIEVSESENVYEVLKRVYGNDVKISERATENEYPFKLVISSYNGKVSCNISFKIKGVTEIPSDAFIVPDVLDIPPYEDKTYVTDVNVNTPEIIFTEASQ